MNKCQFKQNNALQNEAKLDMNQNYNNMFP